MDNTDLLRAISDLDDLVLAKAFDDPAAPAMHAQFLADLDAKLRKEHLRDLDWCLDRIVNGDSNGHH